MTRTYCLTNGFYSYLPDLRAIEEGGYDTACADLAPGAAGLLADTAVELLSSI